MPNEGAFAIHNKQQKRESFTFPLSADLTFILTRLAFPLKRSREGTGDKGEVREGEREWKTPATGAQKIRISIWRNHTCDKANSIKAGLWRKLTSAVRINPFWRLRILYLIGQHTNEAISIATPNAGELITGCGCQGNSIRVSEGANEENMELSRPPHTQLDWWCEIGWRRIPEAIGMRDMRRLPVRPQRWDSSCSALLRVKLLKTAAVFAKSLQPEVWSHTGFCLPHSSTFRQEFQTGLSFFVYIVHDGTTGCLSCDRTDKWNV